jgi:DNA invertase Pin-like site-specific DNA recombinase
MPSKQPRFTKQKQYAPRKTLKAAQYLRASTDHQQFSIENQQHVISEYAKARSIEIVHTYIDPARTGVTMRKRVGLKRLISDIQSGHPPFNVILVYDVSRWGRFQDTDESAHYEFLCKSNGVTIRYCAEQFDNDGALVNNVIKNMKRAMAGEYSRDLSARVSRGHYTLARLGYHQGGPANFGLRRLLVDEQGNRRLLLRRGQRKVLSTDRVILVLGPREETDVVREVFQLFAEKGWAKRRIASFLNERNLRNSRGLPWTGHTIDHLLRCERYIGTLAYNRTSVKLGSERVDLPRQEWIVVENAIEPIVTRKMFNAAQNILNDVWPVTDNDLLDYLTAALCKNGFLSAKIIERSSIMPSMYTYFEHFGSLNNSYRLIGYKRGHRYRYRGHSELLCRIDQRVTAQIIADLTKIRVPSSLEFESHVLTINEHLTITVVLVPYLATVAQVAGWKLRLTQLPRSQAILLGRLNVQNTDVLDFHLLPRCIFLQPTFRFTSQNIEKFSFYRLENLSSLHEVYIRNYFGKMDPSSEIVLPGGQPSIS